FHTLHSYYRAVDEYRKEQIYKKCIYNLKKSPMQNQAQENGNGNIENSVLSKKSVDALEKQIRTYEQEKHILLELSNDFTKVREKNDLIKIFSSRLKGFFYFTHAVIALADIKKGTYNAFLIDKK